jgi:AcrR family transcriptional regulator
MREVTTSEPERPGREAKKVLQRHRILDAAREVFFRDGFMAANLDEVAQIAGVAKGTLYRYFENKADLYVAVLADNGQVFAQRLEEAATSARSPAEQIRALGRFYFGHWSRNREYFQIFWALENEGLIGDLPRQAVEDVTRLWQSCLQMLADVIQRGVDAGDFAPCDAWEVANILWTVANGLIQTAHVGARRELRARDLQQVFDDMVELFLRGLAAPIGR